MPFKLLEELYYRIILISLGAFYFGQFKFVSWFGHIGSF